MMVLMQAFEKGGASLGYPVVGHRDARGDLKALGEDMMTKLLSPKQ